MKGLGASSEQSKIWFTSSNTTIYNLWSYNKIIQVNCDPFSMYILQDWEISTIKQLHNVIIIKIFIGQVNKAWIITIFQIAFAYSMNHSNSFHVFRNTTSQVYI